MKLLKIKPPLFALAYLLFFSGLHFLIPQAKNITLPHRIVGTLVILLGLSLMLWAWTLFQKAHTVLSPTETPKAFVEEGPFQMTRNPMYVGITLILLGIAIFMGGVFVFFAPVAFFLTVHFVHIPHEEKKLEKTFEEKYLGYKKKTRKWI